MSEPSKEAMVAAREVYDKTMRHIDECTEYDIPEIARIIDAAHARIREQAKAWRAQLAMHELEPQICYEDGVCWVEWLDDHFEYSERTNTYSTREAAMIAAADAALGEGWDA